ncbi:MAG: recombinase family protein, partial [Butyricicoccaceae bacterium]
MKRVAVYCRVSTDSEDQRHSFESQQRYFVQYIREHADWQLAAVFADEGLSGTSTAGRVQFLRMIEQARSGAFDLIVT